MTSANRPGRAFRLFTFRGIDVYLHWTWFLIAVIEVQWRRDAYASILFNIIEVLAIFGFVLLHEFGHSLACRSVGGTASRIMLWPLGGVAYVQPPARPGALLWSISAGPLVNLLLVPLTFAGALLLGLLVPDLPPDVNELVLVLVAINLILLVFNLLPIYPLDGGQILRALLWFVIGRERSLLVAAGIGLVASVLGGLAALVLWQDLWLAAIAAYAAWRSWIGLKVARVRAGFLARPRHEGIRCPICGEAPPKGSAIRCAQGHLFDPFAEVGRCPHCGGIAGPVPCLFCENVRPLPDWMEARPDPEEDRTR